MIFSFSELDRGKVSALC